MRMKLLKGWLNLGFIFSLLLLPLTGCQLLAVHNQAAPQLDVLIVNGLVYTGEHHQGPQALNVGIKDRRIVYLDKTKPEGYQIKSVIDAKGKIVSPGFIDPHTHSLGDLSKKQSKANLNYLMQGVTTVFNGNDGSGSPYVQDTLQQLQQQGIGTNLALFAGHGVIREIVMGREDRTPSEQELHEMKALLDQAMQQGAFGLSTGLFYVPGTYANTKEVIELAKVASVHGGVYESHIRDESSYNIGVEAAVDEALTIGKQANIPVHLAHIKALGVDVWGKSKAIVAMVEQAHKQGLIVTADQYPWRASGVRIHKATVPAWALAGSEQDIQSRFKNAQLLPGLKAEMAENIRRRGGPDSLLIVTSSQPQFQGKTLAELAQKWQMNAVDAAIEIMSYGVNVNGTRVASFNMSVEDIHYFMQQPWVMTSSDGNDGHPRKYASYPKKYQEYVVKEKLLSKQEFIYRSAGLVADTFGIKQRGYLREGYFADINIWSAAEYRPNADFSQWNRLSGGIYYQWINGQLTIEREQYSGALPGVGLKHK